MADKNWHRISSRTIFESSIVNLRARLSVNPRNQKESEFYIAEFPDWANIIALTPEKHVVLIRQFRHGTGRIEVELPGGCVDPGEAPLHGAVRELSEETGYNGENPRLIGSMSPNPSFQTNNCYTYLIENAVISGSQNLDDGEDIEVFTIPLEEVDTLIDNGELTNSMIIAAFYFLKKAGIS